VLHWNEGSVENNGRSAAYNGLSHSDCPFKRGKNKWIWLKGYFDVKNDVP
jgi:ribosome modulation factor